MEGLPEAIISGGSLRPESTFVELVREHTLEAPDSEAISGRYEVFEKLGEGSWGEVLGAWDVDIGRRVAIKRIRPDQRDPRALNSLLNEVRTIGQLDHPGIVAVHDVGRDQHGEPFFVMRYAEGATLSTIIERLRRGDRSAHERFTFAARVRIVLGVLHAIERAHQKGFVHRDIKPANIVVGLNGEVQVLDWGVAAPIDEVAHHDPTGPRGPVVGTPPYMAPEQARGRAVDTRTDVYALGVVLHELLTLHHYLADVTDVNQILREVQTRHITRASLARSPHQPRVPTELGHVVQRATAKDPEERYHSVRQMIEALERIYDGYIDATCPVTLQKAVLRALEGLAERYPPAIPALLVTGSASWAAVGAGLAWWLAHG